MNSSVILPSLDKKRFVCFVVLSCGLWIEKPARGQDVSDSIEPPQAEGISSAPIASFQGAATGETETAAPSAGTMNAPTATGNPETMAQHNRLENKKAEGSSPSQNDLTQSPAYRKYFLKPAPAVSVLDPDDFRNGPTYRKFFTPVADRSPRLHKKRGAARHNAGAEHYGAVGHRHRSATNIEESHNAETVIGRQTLGHFIEGTNALQAMALSTPGASFASTDPGGADSALSSFYLRGYNQGQLGFTMDGIPLGSQNYGGYSGVNANQIIIQENILSVSASQGAGALDTPSNTLLGGAVTYTTLDPSEKFGVNISQQFGSFSQYRTFGRLDSGRLNHTGTKFQASFMRNAQNMWTGGGYQSDETVNFKLVQPVSSFGKVTLTSDWSDTPQYNPVLNTAHMLHSFGYGDHNLYPDYDKSKQWASACRQGKGGASLGLSPQVSNADICNISYQGSQVERAYVESLRSDFQISPAIKSSSLVYGQVSDNRLGSTVPGMVTPYSGVNMVEMDMHMKGRRVGVTQNFELKLGRRNTLKTGIWYENNRFNKRAFYYGYGVNDPVNNDFGLKDADGFHVLDTRLTTNTFQFYTEDALTLSPKMHFTYGFKSLVQTTNGGMINRIPSSEIVQWGAPANSYRPVYGRLTSSNAFLPHFNYDWNFLPKHEMYFDVAENMMPINQDAWSSGLGNASGLGTAQVQFQQEKKNLRPERTWNYVVGYRYTGKPFSFGIDYYHTDYINRLGMVQTGSSVDQAVSSYLANLGREKMDGVDLVGVAHLSHILRIPDYLGHLDFTNSFSYNHAVYENDAVPTANGPISIKGVQQVYYPRYMWKTNINYANGRLGWNLNVNYNSARNVTYSGDVKAPAYWESQFTGYWMLGPRGRENKVKLNFGVTNLFGQHYVGGTFGGTDLKAKGEGNNNGSPNMGWAAPREFFGAVNVAF